MAASDACPGLDVTQDGPIRIITLDRPETGNALNDPLIDSLTHCLEALPHDLQTRVVVLRARGRHFCSGVDLKDWASEAERPAVPRVLETQRRICRIFRLLRTIPQPVVALGHGAACGGGFSMLLASDIRYGAPDLRMNAAYIKVGLGGCDMASSYLLPRLAGSALASEMLLTGRFLHADRALRAGLLSEIVPQDDLLAKGMEVAREMCALAPLALRLTKDLLNINIDAAGFDAAVAAEDRQQVMLAMTADHREAVAAFVEKRDPVFRGM